MLETISTFTPLGIVEDTDVSFLPRVGPMSDETEGDTSLSLDLNARTIGDPILPLISLTIFDDTES